MPEELVTKISPEAGRKLRKHIKVPLIVTTLCAGFSGGSSLTFVKCFGEIVKGPELSGNVLFAMVLVIVGVLAAVMQMFMLN